MKGNIFRTVICSLLLVMCCTMSVDAQSDNVKKMKKKAANLRNEIDKQKTILLSTQEDVNSQLRNLRIIEDRIARQKELVSLLKDEVAAIDREIEQINSDIAIQQERVERSRSEYAEALRRARKFGKAKNKFHYVMAADDFRTMMRRYRYANNYMDAHDRLAKSLEGQIRILESKNAELKSTREQREASVKQQESVAAELRNAEKEQRNIVDKLQKQTSKLQEEIKKKQKELNRQNKLIDDEIERILREEEATKKRAAEAARKNSSSKGGSTSSKSTSSKSGKKGEFVENAGVSSMSGDFERNKNKMPVPITGAYIVVEHFGTQNVIGNNGVKIKNNGIVFEGSPGARARCVFNGKVQRVINDGNYHFILVRHDSYITIYCNIVNPCVKEGSNVKAGDILGDVGIDPKLNVPRMQFQMRKGRQMLNPANWIKL